MFFDLVLIAGKVLNHLIDEMKIEERLVFVDVFDDGVFLGFEGDSHFLEFHDLVELVLVEEVMEVVEGGVFFHEILDDGVEHVWFVVVRCDGGMELLWEAFELIAED